jgi:UDPglucose 6-dehydrogenase
MLNPDMILIGESDPRSGDTLEGFYNTLCESNPRIQRMNYVNAELTKLSVNTFVTTKISYANMLAQVCETLPGADVDVVTSAIGCDSRIGVKYLQGALGYGGPCFPRDNMAFSALARANGVPAVLAEATDELNRRQIPRIAELIMSRLPERGVAGILGLAYKPDTDVIEESQGLGIAQELLARGASVVVYDPAAMENARPLFGGKVSFAGSAAECARKSDVIAITTPWPEFRSLSSADLKVGSHRPVVVDCWRVLSRSRFGEAAEFLALGSAPASKFTSDTAVNAASAAEAD